MPMDSANEKARLESAVRRLGTVMTEIVTTAEQKNKERCPYKTADWLCTFAGGCRNQLRDVQPIRCGGDEFILLWNRDDG